jgi:DNA-binding MltR family transcriptional regulator
MTDLKQARRLELLTEFTAFRAALSQESDRGCALFAAAYLDTALADMLRASLVKNKKMDDDLFESQGPLSTFSAKIKLAYYLGKLSPSERRDLDTIRSIRNDFAHHAATIDFDSQSIRDRCSNLVIIWHSKDSRPRAKYTASVSGVLAKIHAETVLASAPNECPERPVPEEVKERIRARARKEEPES